MSVLKDVFFRPLFADRRKDYQQVPIERRKITSKEAAKMVECSIERLEKTVTVTEEKLKELLHNGGKNGQK